MVVLYLPGVGEVWEVNRVLRPHLTYTVKTIVLNYPDSKRISAYIIVLKYLGLSI